MLRRKWRNDTGDKEGDVTCLAVISAVTAWTVTRVIVDLLFTAPPVLTGTAGTLVDVCGDQKNKKTHTHTQKVPSETPMLCFIVNGWTGDWMGRRARRWKGVQPVSVPA